MPDKKPAHELQLSTPTGQALERLPEPSLGQMMQAVIEKGVTSENADALCKLAGEYRLMEEWKDKRDSERAFATAFVELQAEMQNVKAVRAVPNNDGSVRYKFAPFEEIMKEVGPRLKAHGFTLTFSTDYAEGRMIKICTLQHVGGHKRDNKFAVRIGKGPPAASETQADGAASTYAKRGALCDALNIVIDHDDDARAEGGSVTKEQAAELKRRVLATGTDEGRFLKYAGADSYEEISAVKYDMLDENLKKKERTA